MKTKLIQTKDYLLLIDREAEIKPDDYIIHDTVEGVIEANDEWHYRGEKDDYWNKVIAYYPLTKEAKELDLLLLPSFEIDVDELAEASSEKHHYAFGHQSTMYQLGFLEGYKAAQPKQFSLEDIKKAIEMARKEYTWTNQGREGSTEWYYSKEQIIQSLSTQQLPKEFIPEYNLMNKGYDEPEDYPYQECKVLKTITNSEGKSEVVGMYKY